MSRVTVRLDSTRLVSHSVVEQQEEGGRRRRRRDGAMLCCLVTGKSPHSINFASHPGLSCIPPIQSNAPDRYTSVLRSVNVFCDCSVRVVGEKRGKASGPAIDGLVPARTPTTGGRAGGEERRRSGRGAQRLIFLIKNRNIYTYCK